MNSDTLSRLIRAGALTAIIDGLFSSILSAFFYGSTVTRLWQGVASVPIGRQALDGGVPMALVGILMHVGVAFTWSAVFLFLVMRLPWIQRVLSTRFGAIKVAALYGPLIWVVMSVAVIPLLTERPPTIGFRWWVQFFGHFPFVGIPIVASCASAPIRSQTLSATRA